ncbi:MAG: hypothetical protein CR982_01025 [Candidatus Cloacimonadota bacterium]|nr:MAG: hypothetical protein CR982_01025 [Candidatus Cloacimonadota bacterium]PIE77758.1 MAG: hypothetical protein CSA15_11225 [Candidatus Delongbacteria bacterium]
MITQRIEEKEYTIFLKIFKGDIKIVQSNDENLTLEFEKVRKGTLNEVIEIEFNDNFLHVSQKDEKTKLFKSIDCSLTLSLPKGIKYNSEIKNFNGDISIKDIDQKLKLESFNGDVDIENSNSHISGTIYRGDLEISQSTLELDIKNMSGDIDIKDSKIKTLAIKSYSGDLEIKSSDFNLLENGTIKSFAGDITIDAKSYMGEKNISAKSLSGDIKINNIPEHLVEVENLKSNIPIMNSNLGSKLSSIMKNFSFGVNKNIEVEVNTKDDNKGSNIDRILKMLEDGKISSEEATKLILALNN